MPVDQQRETRSAGRAACRSKNAKNGLSDLLSRAREIVSEYKLTAYSEREVEPSFLPLAVNTYGLYRTDCTVYTATGRSLCTWGDVTPLPRHWHSDFFLWLSRRASIA
jgi:hypothetical protein